MAEINRATAVTPGAVVATALLNHPRRGISEGELIEMSGRLTQLLTRLGARVSAALVGPDGALREEAVRDAVGLFLDAEMVVATVPGEGTTPARRRRAKIYTGPDVIYAIPDDKRLSLDLSKNIIVHFFVPRALVAAGLSAPRGPENQAENGIPAQLSLGRATLEDRVQKLSRLFKFEFMFRADATFEQIFAETLSEMVTSGELVEDAKGQVECGPGHDGLDGRGWIGFYASITRTFLEGYRVAARGLAFLLKGPAAQKDLVKRALVAGDRMFLGGEIERKEAVSRPTLENAYLAFADQGYLTLAQGKATLAESFATAAAVRAIESKVAGYFMSEVQN
jgi:glycerol-3-phosphate O-acyltransferase